MTPATSQVDHVLRNPLDEMQALIPLVHQWKFATSQATHTFLAGGWGSAKSVGLALFLAISAMYNPPGTGGLLVMPTFKLLSEFLDMVLKPTFGDLIIGESKKKNTLYLQGGRRLVYLSGHVPERIEAYTVSYAGVDEPGLMHPSIFHRLSARCRDARTTWRRIGYTGVPLWGWLKSIFVDEDEPDRRILHCSIDDNTHLNDDARASIIASIPARLRDCYAHGKFVPPGFRVYHEFQRDRHMVPFKFEQVIQVGPDRKYASAGVIIDPSPRNPHVLFAQDLPAGYELIPRRPLARDSSIIFDELHPGGPDDPVITTERLCQLALAKGYPLRWCIMDPAGIAVEATSGMTQLSIIQRMLNLSVEYETDSELRLVTNGVEMVQRMLDPLEGDPLLYFADDLAADGDPRAVVNAVENYSYPEHKVGYPITNKPHKDGITDHACDDIRYLAINRYPVERLAVRVWNAA